MGRKILKILFIILLVIAIFTICLIGYRASIVYKIYKANKLVFSSDNIKIVSEDKDNLDGDDYWKQTIVCRKGNIARTKIIYDFANVDFVYDLDNELFIDVINKEFDTLPDLDIHLFSDYGYYSYGCYFYIDAVKEKNKPLMEKFFNFKTYAKMVLNGNPHYFIDENGREAFSIQYGVYIDYYDKETGIMYERYQSSLDGTKNLIQKFNVKFDVVTEDDLDYGDISEYYYHVQ